MKIPTVSIGLPVYNGENYLKEAIDSILSQTYKDFELIISDNASTDTTTAICRTYADQDSRIRYYRSEKNMGAAWNFNRVFHLARGEYFQWACHDDILISTFLDRCVDVLRKMPEVVLCYSKTTWINEHGEPIRSVIGRPDLHISDPHQRFRRFLNYHNPPNECSPVVSLFRSNVLKNTSLHGNFPASDMILLGEIVFKGEWYEIPECLLLRRDHPQKSTTAYPSMEERAIWLDPGQKGKIQMTTCRWIYEWLRTIIISPIGVIERIKCVMEVWNWGRCNRKKIKKELKSGVKKFIYQKT
jgi:glycosyltransferase involved in cell wall biosynthesis